jgi:type I restriction enzyme S subunit
VTASELKPLPNSWSWTKIQDISETTSGGTPSRKNKEFFMGTIPWLKSGELADNLSINSSEEAITEQALNNSNAKIIPKGSLLVALYGATVGKLGLLAINAAINQAICAIQPYEGIYSKYLFYYLSSYRKNFLNARKGGAQPNISQEIVKNAPIPIAPSAEQLRIVGKVEELFSFLDAGVASLWKVRAQLKRYRQAVLKYAFEGKLTEEWRKANKYRLKELKKLLPVQEFSRNIDLPEEWTLARLGEVAEIQMGESPPGFSYNDNCEGYPLLNGPTEFGVENPKPRQWTTKPTRICRKSDLLICVRGNTTGRMNWADQQYCIGRGLASITPIENVVRSSFMYYFLLKEVDEIMRKTTGSTFPNLKSSELRNFELPLAPYLEQICIAEIIETAFSVAYETERTIKKALVQASNLRQRILKNAFAGKLVPQDPNDEPAGKLVERIRAERAKRGADDPAGRNVKKLGFDEQMELSRYVE